MSSVSMVNQLVSYKTLPVWNAQTLPQVFREQHNTQTGTWAQLTVLQGHLKFALLDEQGEITELSDFSVTNQPPLIAPQQRHKIVGVSDDIACQLQFYCHQRDFWTKKYALTPTHSEVIAASQIIKPGKVLDLGCGSGRNSLYLNRLGFAVDAVDKNAHSINQINSIISQEQLKHIQATVYDINQANWQGEYDWIISTVVMMFLSADRIAAIIKNMQALTNPQGYNLIVSAMSTADYPCPIPFSFTFKADELPNYYSNWDILKYNEHIGELHKTDANGQRFKLRFATLLAKKPAL